jgi:hypothetical protein
MSNIKAFCIVLLVIMMEACIVAETRGDEKVDGGNEEVSNVLDGVVNLFKKRTKPRVVRKIDAATQTGPIGGPEAKAEEKKEEPAGAAAPRVRREMADVAVQTDPPEVTVEKPAEIKTNPPATSGGTAAKKEEETPEVTAGTAARKQEGSTEATARTAAKKEEETPEVTAGTAAVKKIDPPAGPAAKAEEKQEEPTAASAEKAGAKKEEPSGVPVDEGTASKPVIEQGIAPPVPTAAGAGNATPENAAKKATATGAEPKPANADDKPENRQDAAAAAANVSENAEVGPRDNNVGDTSAVRQDSHGDAAGQSERKITPNAQASSATDARIPKVQAAVTPMTPTPPEEPQLRTEQGVPASDPQTPREVVETSVAVNIPEGPKAGRPMPPDIVRRREAPAPATLETLTDALMRGKSTPEPTDRPVPAAASNVGDGGPSKTEVQSPELDEVLKLVLPAARKISKLTPEQKAKLGEELRIIQIILGLRAIRGDDDRSAAI